MAAALAAMFCYYGFEACGDVAEETPNASRMIPKAMRMTIYIGGAAATWVCLAFVLAIPDIPAVISGADKDPIVTLLRAAMGEAGFRAVIVVVLVTVGFAPSVGASTMPMLVPTLMTLPSRSKGVDMAANSRLAVAIAAP